MPKSQWEALSTSQLNHPVVQPNAHDVFQAHLQNHFHLILSSSFIASVAHMAVSPLVGNCSLHYSALLSAQPTLFVTKIGSVLRSYSFFLQLTSVIEHRPSRLSAAGRITRPRKWLLQPYSRPTTRSNARSLSSPRLLSILIHIPPSGRGQIPNTHILRYFYGSDAFRHGTARKREFDHAWLDSVGIMSCHDFQHCHTLACKAVQ